MGILEDLLARVRTFENGLQTGSAIRDALQPFGSDILEAQRVQLLEGRNSGGEDIRPYYSEDLKPQGYFYSAESAGRYAAWKQDLSYPYSVKRNPDAPNLYITGRFHSELEVQFNSDSLGIVATSTWSAAIMAKYGVDTFGLCFDKWEEIWEGGAYLLLLNNAQTLLFNG